jgi:hypothetical protein
VFERPDGLLQVEESSVPVNYQGADGVWREIDNRLVADGRGGFVNVANAFRVEFKAMGPGGGVRISADDGQVSFYARNAAAVRPVLAKDGLSVTYPNVLPGSDLVYRVTGMGVEEEFVLRSASSTPTVEFVVSGVGLARESSGLRGGGAGLASRIHVSAPDTYDAKSRPVDVGHVVFSAVDESSGVLLPDFTGNELPVPIEEIGRQPLPDPARTPAGLAAASRAREGKTTTRVTLGVDGAWLRVQPVSVFPVTVDPTIQAVITPSAVTAYAVHFNSGVAYSTLNDGYARTGNPAIGGSNNDVEWRSVFYAPYESYFGAQSVEQAYVNTTYKAGTASAQPLYMNWASQWGWHYPPVAPIWGWAHQPVSTMTTGVQNHGYNGQSQYAMREFYDRWVQTQTPFGSILLSSYNQTYTLKKFSVKMVLVINRWPQDATLVSPASGTSSHSAQQTVTATLPQLGDADGDWVQYRAWACTDSGCGNRVWIDSGWQYAPYQVPPSTVSINVTFPLAAPFTSQ